MTDARRAGRTRERKPGLEQGKCLCRQAARPPRRRSEPSILMRAQCAASSRLIPKSTRKESSCATAGRMRRPPEAPSAARLSVRELDDRRAHVGERSLAGRDRIGAARPGVEPHDSIVHQDPGAAAALPWRRRGIAASGSAQPRCRPGRPTPRWLVQDARIGIGTRAHTPKPLSICRLQRLGVSQRRYRRQEPRPVRARSVRRSNTSAQRRPGGQSRCGPRSRPHRGSRSARALPRIWAS